LRYGEARTVRTLLNYPRSIAALLLLTMAALLVTSARSESPTTDEPLHLARGLAYFWGPDTSLSIAHPPLGNAFAALPIVLSEPKLSLERFQHWSKAQPRSLSKFIWDAKHYETRRTWFFQARMMIAALTVGMALHLFYWSRRLFGTGAALLALLFVATHPTLIAHGRVVTTDMPLTVMMVMALGELLLFLHGASRWHGAAALLLTALSPMVKFSGVLQIVITSGLLFAAAAARVGRFRGHSRVRAIALALGLTAALGIGSLFLVNAAYRFEKTGWTAQRLLDEREPANGRRMRGKPGERIEHSSFVAHLPGWVRVPLPYTFVFGTATLREHVEKGHESTFFGEVSRDGNPSYFPVMLLIKTPLLQLAGLLCALVLLLRQPRQVQLAAWSCGVFALLYLITAMRGSINIGVRHVLPMMPVLALLAALGIERTLSRVRIPESVVAAAFALHVLGVAWSFPDYLSDFNALVLGRYGGERISIIGEEWDQDILRLAERATQQGVKELYFNSGPVTTQVELGRRGIHMIYHRCRKTKLPPGAYVAVSARELARDSKGCWEWTKQQTPVFQVGQHIYVYRYGDAS
jgi:hypothetical protein